MVKSNVILFTDCALIDAKKRVFGIGVGKGQIVSKGES
jgi:hypothetical protein